ncbi:hypothetical protein VPHK406_0090 [Vibrio phage K406]
MCKDTIKEQGWDEYYVGSSRDSNPCPPTDTRHWDWDKGFTDAMFNDNLSGNEY